MSINVKYDPKVTHKINSFKFDQFNMKYWNINSMRNKIFEIENEVSLVSNKTVHFVALTETRIFENEIDLFNLPNFKAYFSCRDDGHGGAALFVHESLDSSLVESACLFKINYVIVKIPALRASIAVLYKKPTVSNSKFFAVLTQILSKTNNIILIGDTNINVQKHGPNITEYLSLIESLGCRLLNSTNKKFATRINQHVNARHTTSSTIDHVITSCLNYNFNFCVNDSHLSDHQEIFLSFKDTSNRTVNFSETNYSFTSKYFQFDNFKRLLARELSLYTPKNLNTLLRLIENTKKRCVRSRVIFNKINPYKKWVSAELTELITERNRYHKLLKRCPANEFIKNKYLEYCNLTKSMNNRIRRIHNSSQLNKFVSKPRQLWKCFNEIIHNKPYSQNEIKTISCDDGSTTHDPLTIANTINTYFCHIGRELFARIPHTEPTYNSLIPNNSRTMALFPVTPEEICSIIFNTKPNSNLSNILPVNYIKQCLDILLDPITDMVNKCFDTGCFPEILKTARVVPIFKSGDSLSPSNYRPISILDDFSKILEQCIFHKISAFTTKYDLISKFQFGFQKHSGTLSAASCLLDSIRLSLDASILNICAAIFIDVTKAFDSIFRELLLKKLYRLGFRGNSYNLIESFLSNRMQFISMANVNSDPLNIEFGTPQGSTLGPALFILFINDITNLKLHGKIVLFADDAVITYCETDVNELNRKMIEDMQVLSQWFSANKLTLNRKKTKCMIFHQKQHIKKFRLDIHCDGEPIEQVETFEYLGLTLQENLQWDMHIDKISTKINRISGVIHRIGNTVDTSTLKSIYYAHVHSHLAYMSPIWGQSATEYLLNTIQVIQNNAIRSIFRKEYYAFGLSTNQIRTKFNILNVRQISKYETAILAYKINKKIIKTNIETIQMSSRHNYNTRNSNQLYQQSFRTKTGKYLISRLIAVEFNMLPTDLQSLPSLNQFKNKLKKYILSDNQN